MKLSRMARLLVASVTGDKYTSKYGKRAFSGFWTWYVQDGDGIKIPVQPLRLLRLMKLSRVARLLVASSYRHLYARTNA